MKNSVEYLDKIVNILETPYFYELENYGINVGEEMEYILGKIYGYNIIIRGSNIFDSKGKSIYYENRYGYWLKREYDTSNNVIYSEESSGYWIKREFDSYGNRTYYENSTGYWEKTEYDSNDNMLYFENSNGRIIDTRNI